MRICHCHAVSDREIRAALHDGARTVGQVARSCGAGKGCGGCVPAIAELLEASPVRGLQVSRQLPLAARDLPLVATPLSLDREPVAEPVAAE